MSDIPFVNRLGDAIDAALTASAEPARRRRRRRRGAAVAVGALLTAGGGVALGGLFSNPTQLAATSVSCYETPDLRGGTTVVWPGGRSPTQACVAVLRDTARPVASLVACDRKTGVVVFPGNGERACDRAGLRPLRPQYSTEHARVEALERALFALEDSADCIAPREFASRVQTILKRTGWAGWRPWLRLDITSGPCGLVSSYGGNSVRTIGGHLDARQLRVMIFAGAHRSTEKLLAGPKGIGGPLIDASGERCYTQHELHALARRRFAPTGRSVAFTASQPDRGVTLEGPRGSRLAAGCAIITDVTPAKDGRNITVHTWQRE